MLLTKFNKILNFFKYTFLLIFFFQFNVYALNFDNKNHIFLLDFKPQDGSATSSVGEIIYQNNNRIALNVYDANDDFKLIYNTQNLSKPWSTTSNFKFQGLNAADLFNYLYILDHGLKNVDTSKPYFPKSFQNRTLSTALKLFPGQNNDPAMRKMVEEMLFVIRSKLNYKGKECYLGRESYVFNQNSSRSFKINYLNIDYQIFVKFNNFFYVDIETGLISSKEDGSFTMAGQNEKYTNLLNFNFLKKNCGSQNNQINTKVKNAYINAKNNNSYLAFIKNNNIVDNNSSSSSDTYTASSPVGNLYCQNTTTKRVYETSRSDCIGKDISISKNSYNKILASNNNQNNSNNNANNLKLELDTKLPDWHFNKNDDYYILGLDNKGNKLVGSASFIDPYAAQPISRGNYYYLKDTYDETISKSCFFTSTAQSNRIVSNELRAKGSMTLECNGKTLKGLWEQKGNLGTFITNDKSIYGVFKKTKFDYLGTYLLPNNTYNRASANSIYDSVRSGSFEDPWDEYNKISKKITLASSQYYQNEDNFNNNLGKNMAIVKSADIKFKRVPSISSKTLGYLSINQTLEILPRDPVKDTIGSYWINVIDPKSGKKGWVQDRYLDMSNETYLVNNQNNQKNSFNNKKENYLYCLNNNNEITTRYSTQLKEKCPAGSSKTSELAWINYESQKNNKSDPVNVDLIFDISEIKIVNANPLNIRETPNGKWKSILSRGEKVAIIEENSDKSWNKIVSEDGQMGWVSSKYLVDDLSNIASNEEINSKEILIQEEIVQNQEPEINVAKKTFDEIEPTISCSKNEIYTKEKTALIDCKITDNNEVYKVFINGNEIQLKANRIKEKFPVVIGKSQLELLVFDKAGNETKELISVEREFSFVSQIKEFEPLQPGLISSPINKNRIAIIVGIKDYKDIPDTKYADKDAFTFIDYANETLGINSSNIKYFINDSAGFLDFKTIDKWLSTKINKNTEVFVFYSGHGANNNGQSLLLPSDFRTDLIDDSSITKEGFLQQIADQNPKHIFAFFDACFSGLSREGETLIAGLRNISIVEEEVPFSNITIFNSASGAEFSSDFDEVGHGLFSYYLMKGLEGEADNNSDQQISTSELYDYIYANVSEQSINLGPQQNPSLITNDDQIIVRW